MVWYPTDLDADRDAQLDPQYGAVFQAPVADGDAPDPYVVSHGSGGRPTNSIYLTAHLASDGFLVAAPPHPSNTGNDCPFTCSIDLDLSGIEASRANRSDDVRFVISELRRLHTEPGAFLFGQVAPTPVGVTGHSFGGLTALRVGVEAQSRTQSEIGALVALAPTLDDDVRAGLPNSAIPLMMMGGARDAVTPIQTQRDLYDLAKPPRALVALERAGHLVFADRCRLDFAARGDDAIEQERAHTIINRFATAFFRHYLKSGTNMDP